MENISRIKEKCVGCKSCEQSCPKHCISIVENKEGFWYPSVDEKSCIECKVCLKKCPVENTEFHRNEPHKVWAWRNKNDVDIMRSASGGAADSATKTIAVLFMQKSFQMKNFHILLPVRYMHCLIMGQFLNILSQTI